jgi:hypothetical protein
MTDTTDRLAAALSDRYRIERELGAGGMATVYLAEDLKHQRQVAIKVLKPELAAVLGAERFVQEITTTAQLQHPHILPLFDSGTADGFLFYVMPFVEGETLRDKLNRETQLGVDEAVKITREVADALDYAHRHGVIHRDIKPENILLHDGRPMVADFGIALAVSAAAGGRMTETGMSLGTPHYMSPEQATADKEITGRSDVYSLASVLYEMLTGDPPHVGSSAQQIIVKIIADEARPVGEVRKSVPPNVAAAVAKALEKLPADRFESAQAFSDALADPNFHLAGSEGAGVAGAGASARRPVGLGARLRDPFVLAPSVVALAAVVVAGILARRAPPIASTLPPIRFVLTTTDSVKPLDSGPWPGAISPDGGTVIYRGMGPGGRAMLYSLRTDELEAHPSPDGTALVVQAFLGSWDLLRIPVDSAAAVARPYAASRFDEQGPQFSPDGRWVAYISNKTGQYEVYVRSFPDPSKNIQISTGGGGLPVWSADGSRLYYGNGSALLDARVSLSPTFRLLGRDTVVSTAGLTGLSYGLSPDGARVLSVKSVSSGYRLEVSPNWGTELRKRLAASEGESGGG